MPKYPHSSDKLQFYFTFGMCVPFKILSGDLYSLFWSLGMGGFWSCMEHLETGVNIFKKLYFIFFIHTHMHIHVIYIYIYVVEISMIQQISNKIYSDRLWMRGREAVVSEPLLKIVESLPIFPIEKRTVKPSNLWKKNKSTELPMPRFSPGTYLT